MNGAIARIILRYGVGLLAGASLGDRLAADTDVVMIIAVGIGALIEAGYVMAKKRGWSL